MWEAIAYVSSGVTLAAFLAAAATWILKAKSDEKVKLIDSASDENKAKLVQDAMEFFHIDTTGLTKEHRYNIALEQIKERANRFKLIAILICILALIAAALSAYALSLSAISKKAITNRVYKDTGSELTNLQNSKVGIDKESLEAKKKVITNKDHPEKIRNSDIRVSIYIDGVPPEIVTVYLLEVESKDVRRDLKKHDKGQFEFKDVSGVTDEIRFSIKLPGYKEKIVICPFKPGKIVRAELSIKDLISEYIEKADEDIHVPETELNSAAKIPPMPIIIFQSIQNKHKDVSMKGVEERATVLIKNALHETELFKMIKIPSGLMKADINKLYQKYPGLNYLVSGTMTGDASVTEITLEFIDVTTGIIAENLKAFNITTPHIDYIVQKLFLKIKDAFGMRVKSKPKKRKMPGKREIIVICTFQNKGKDKSLDYMVNNIAEGLTTELSGVERYIVREKNQIEKIYEEQKLTSSGLFDFKTTVERGRLWAPRYIIVGSFRKDNYNVHIDARMVDLETGVSKCSDSVSGPETDLFSLNHKLANKFKSCF
ncbi:MAG: hypothetical protein GY749_21390 [Desulfobacteraceae bacterium]|nr:hypothetical protein [Desulfobacteraceae bacterium]